MAESSIEWTDYTFNGWIGCTRVSPGCDNCYAAAQDRFRGWTPEGWGAGKPRRRTSVSNWKQPLRWNRIATERGARARVFCSSLADVFDNEAPNEWRLELAKLIAGTPMLDWQLLTKRIGNAGRMLEAMFPAAVPENVWVGATIVNREELLRDGPKLMATPARIRFWSAEPLLADLGELPQALVPDWVIIGGESGPKARAMDLAWAESLVKRCEAGGAKVFMKQLGAKPQQRGEIYEKSRGKGSLMIEWPSGLRIRDMPAVMLAG
jgi:protein gp37